MNAPVLQERTALALRELEELVDAWAAEHVLPLVASAAPLLDGDRPCARPASRDHRLASAATPTAVVAREADTTVDRAAWGEALATVVVRVVAPMVGVLVLVVLAMLLIG